MSKIFSVTVKAKKNNKNKRKFQNQLKKLNFDKTFENMIENELDFNGYGTAQIDIQQQSDEINPFTCGLHQTLFDTLYLNPALKMINITLAYENNEKNIDFEVRKTKDRLNLIMTPGRELSAPIKKKVRIGYSEPKSERAGSCGCVFYH